MAEGKLDEIHPERMKKMLEILARPSKFHVNFASVDDFGMMPKVLFVEWRFVFKLFFRLWPFRLWLSFPTRYRLAKTFIDRGAEEAVWLINPVINISWPRNWRPKKWR
jgi:hypothetical protein